MRGRPCKGVKPKTEVLQLRLTPEEKKLIKYLSELNGNVSMAELIMELVVEEITKWEIEDAELDSIGI